MTPTVFRDAIPPWAFELTRGVVAALVTNRWTLPAVAALVPVMLVAAATAGPTPQNVAVLLGCVALAADELARLNRQGRDAGPRTGC